MAKKKGNKKRNDPVSMEISTVSTVADRSLLQAMDTSEGIASKTNLGIANGKIKKGAPVKRSKNLRKLKAVEKAISKSDQTEEKISKNKVKKQRIQSAKTLYE